jgi:hypothetical protein
MDLKKQLTAAYEAIGGGPLEKWAKLCARLDAPERHARLKRYHQLVRACVEASHIEKVADHPELICLDEIKNAIVVPTILAPKRK